MTSRNVVIWHRASRVSAFVSTPSYAEGPFNGTLLEHSDSDFAESQPSAARALQIPVGSNSPCRSDHWLCHRSPIAPRAQSQPRESCDVCQSHFRGYPHIMKQKLRFAAATVAMTAGLGLVGLGGAASIQAQPGTFPTDPWCPGSYWNPIWGPNWDWDHCHDSYGGGHGYDGDHGYGPYGPGDGGHGGGGH